MAVHTGQTISSVHLQALIKKLCILIFFGLSTAVHPPHPYSVEYQKECAETFAFYDANRAAFNLAATKSGVSSDFLFSIVAPEISQYNYLRDKVESYGLKVLYVQGGSAYANFSIGPFQMKPSFAKSLEQHVVKNELLKKKYEDLIIIKTSDVEKRKERVKRLSDLNYQLLYLSLFCEIVKEKHKPISGDELSKLNFYSTAYNYGFDRETDLIRSMNDKAYFPRFSSNKYPYGEVAEWFFQQIHQ